MAQRTNVRNFLKRKADTADLNDGEESASRLEKKARLREELEFLRTRLRPKVAFRRPPSPPKVAFRRPPSPPNFQLYEEAQYSGPARQREKALRPSQSQVGSNRDNPLVLEDNEGLDQVSGSEVGTNDQNNPLGSENDEGPDKGSGPTSARRKKSSVHINDQDNPLVPKNNERSTQHSASHTNITSPRKGQHQCASTPQEHQGQRASVKHGEKWEIEKIVDKRRTSGGYEYKVRWQDTWLPGSELENRLELMRRFEREWLSRGE